MKLNLRREKQCTEAPNQVNTHVMSRLSFLDRFLTL